jgi:6-pyruvoyltetrahydropterin/6-carboxytetrahydropterin synthase
MHVLTTKRFEFSAAHRYWNADWGDERNLEVFGKCTNPHGHGHNYVLEVTVAGDVDPATGMVMNVTELKALVGEVLEGFDHKHLNEDTPWFRDRQPTTENIVQVLWDLIAKQLGGRAGSDVALHRLRLYETPDIFADYHGDDTATFGRAYRFSAAHRLDSPALDADQNRAVYGRCNNPNGHGHDYRLEVLVDGPVDARTGMVINLVDLDTAVGAVTDELDHTHLDRQHAFFTERPSTAENVAGYLWARLAAALGGQLRWLKLWETPNNVFELGVVEP